MKIIIFIFGYQHSNVNKTTKRNKKKQENKP